VNYIRNFANMINYLEGLRHTQKKLWIYHSLFLLESFDFQSIPWIPPHNLAGTHAKLTNTVCSWRAIIINITYELTTGSTLEFGPLSLNSPMVQGLKEGHNLVFLFKSELGVINGREWEGVLVACFKVEICRVLIAAAEIQRHATLCTTVGDWSHRRWRCQMKFGVEDGVSCDYMRLSICF